MKITVVGTGYVGQSNAILFAQNNEVIALEIVEEKVELINQKKSPIVVPRKIKFGEHVNDHQLDFAIKIRDKGYEILVVDDINLLGEIISNYQNNEKPFESNNQNFNEQLKKITKELLGVI